jgi:nitric oxide reductase NorQ protein
MYEITKPEIWFFKTVNEKSENGVARLKLLPGQWVPDPASPGNFIPGNTELNTKSDLKPREVHPIGTIFASKFIEIQNSPSGNKFYNAKKDTSQQLICIASGVTVDIKNAYEEYLKQAEAAEVLAKLDKDAKKANPTPGLSFLDKLLKENPIPTVENDNFYVEADVWASLLFNLHRGYNTMLVGDSGTGKTELSILMGMRLKKPTKVFDMAAKQDPIASLIGVHRFEDGKSVFDRADFTYALEGPNIIVLDELPRAPMNTNNILFPILDSRRELNMDVASHGLRTIKLHPECAFIATANEGYEYTGNNVLDRALKERFRPIMVSYMPEAQEVNLLVNRTTIDKNLAKVIVKVGRSIRDLNKGEDISSSVSIRHTLYAADLAAGGMAVAKAMEIAFLPMFIIEDDRKKVKDLLASR